MAGGYLAAGSLCRQSTAVHCGSDGAWIGAKVIAGCVKWRPCLTVRLQVQKNGMSAAAGIQSVHTPANTGTQTSDLQHQLVGFSRVSLAYLSPRSRVTIDDLCSCAPHSVVQCSITLWVAAGWRAV